MNSENISISIDKPNACQVIAEVKINQEKIKSIFDTTLKNFQTQATMPGFRKGKAPKAMVLKAYKQGIMDETKESAIKAGYNELMQSDEFTNMVDAPAVKPGKLSLDSDFQFTISYEIEPEFELGDYKSISIQRKEVSITTEEVEAALNDLAERQKKIESVKDEPAKLGDMVKASYTGKIDEEVAESAKSILNSEETWIMINEPEILPGIKEALVGAKAGDTVIDTLTFPKDFHEESLAGKSVEYTFDISEVFASIVPELNDEFAKSIGLNSIEETKEKIKENLLQAKKQEVESKLQESALLEVLKLSGDFEIPQSQIKSEIENLKKDNAELSDEEATEKAKERIRAFYILVKLAKEEKINVSQADIDSQIQKMSYYSQKSPQLIQKKLAKEGRLNGISLDILLNKAMERLTQIATNEEITKEA